MRKAKKRPAKKKTTQAELAGKLGISQQRVSQLMKQGVLTGGTIEELLIQYGRHHAKVAARWQSGDGTVDRMREAGLLDRRRREKLELEMAVMQRNLWPAEVILPAMKHQAIVIRSKFLSLPHAFKSQVDYLKPRDVVVLENMVRERLEELGYAQFPREFEEQRQAFLRTLHAESNGDGNR